MNIIFESPAIDHLKTRHILLELDTFEFEGHNQPIKSFCVIDQVPVAEISTIEHYAKLHQSMIDHYHCKKWSVCLDTLLLLQGRWGGTLDSFYSILYQRINELTDQILPADWTGHIKAKAQKVNPFDSA